ncbi:E3 ubiquitin-protein ligase sina, partial [Geodia barretti]
CERRPYACPCPGTSCKLEGPLDDVLNHLLTAHKTITTLGGEDIVFLATDIHLPGAVDWVMIQCCFDHYFMLVLEKQERHEGHQQFFAIVQLIGTEKEANAFRCVCVLASFANSMPCSLSFLSIHCSISSVICSNDCLIFETAMASYFGDNGNLAIIVTIYKTSYY